MTFNASREGGKPPGWGPWGWFLRILGLKCNSGTMFWTPGVVVLSLKHLPLLMCLNTWSPAGLTVLEICGTLKRQSLTGGHESLGVGLTDQPHLTLPVWALLLDYR